jgi:hypothetical protein
MSEYATKQQLSDEQSQTLEQAALLIIKARREAGEILRRADIQGFDDDFFGSKCRQCDVCSEFVGDGEVCERSTCRHNASRHAT